MRFCNSHCQSDFSSFQNLHCNHFDLVFFFLLKQAGRTWRHFHIMVRDSFIKKKKKKPNSKCQASKSDKHEYVSNRLEGGGH